MAGNTPETVWYENVEQGTLHEVEKGSALERRLKKDQREVYEKNDDGEIVGDPDFEPAYRKLTAAEVKKAQENPEKQPGYPAAQEEAKAKAAAEAEAKANQDKALADLVNKPADGDQK